MANVVARVIAPLSYHPSLLTHIAATESVSLCVPRKIRTGKRLLSGATPCQRMQQISCWKQRDTKNGAPKIDVMANAALAAPVHRRKQVECFKDMSQDYYDQASRAD
jgi:hypothetical protein